MRKEETQPLFGWLLKSLSGKRQLTDQTLSGLVFSLIYKAVESPETIVAELIGVLPKTRNPLIVRIGRQLRTVSQIVTTGSTLEKEALAVWMSYGGLGTLDPEVAVRCAKSLDQLHRFATGEDSSLVELCTERYIRELVQSPRPVSEIPRSYGGSEIARLVSSSLPVDALPQQLITHGRPIMEAFAQTILSADYMRQEVPKYLEGYKDLVEGDFKRFVDWVVSLIRITSNQNIEYRRLRRTTLQKKVDEIRRASYARLVRSYNRHIRNSIAHSRYKLEVRRGILSPIIFCDISLGHRKRWKKKMSVLELLGLQSEMSMVLELSLLFCDIRDDRLLKRLSRHRDPGWWARRNKISPKIRRGSTKG
jgi:hypothetical protein